MDPLNGSPWRSPATVAGFAQSSGNATLMRFAEAEFNRGGACAIDIGCGAARNTLPLAQIGWSVLGLDLSQPMLDAAIARVEREGMSRRVQLTLAPMDALPIDGHSIDLIVAHGIWNLAQSGDEFRRAVREAARVARPAAALFVFTFSRRTLSPAAQPIPGEDFVYTDFSGQPQVFLTEAQLVAELGAAGFVPDPAVPLTEHNAPRAGSIRTGTAPVIYEAAFRFTGSRNP